MGKREAGGEAQPRPGSDGWLLLIYRVPAEPATLRASVWRRLRSIGAIYLAGSAAALPAGQVAERALRKIRHEILEMSGSAVLLACNSLAGESDIQAGFQAARDEEYEEIVDRCQDFLSQVEKEEMTGRFTYAELEENEVGLTKLQAWFATVRNRDTLGAPGRKDAIAAVAKCEQALEQLAALVYAQETGAH